MLDDVVDVVGGGEDLRLVDIVDANRLEDLTQLSVVSLGEKTREKVLPCTYLALDKVADPRLRHHGDGHGGHDLLDHLRIRHARDSALDTDVGGDTLQCHDGDGAGLLGDSCLCGFRLECCR